MKIEPVEIDLNEISDKRKFQDLALLIDREDFQKDLVRLKKDIEKLPRYGSKLEEYLKPAYEERLAIKLLTKYKYPPGFAKAIVAALKNGRVANKDVTNCYSIVISLSPQLNPIYTANNEEVLVSVYPYLMKGRKKQILKEIDISFQAMLKLLKPLPKKHPLNLDTRPIPFK